MSALQIPDRVFTQPGDVALLEANIAALPDEAIVQLTMEDGSAVRGVVAVRPSAQIFRTDDGQEGINAVLRLDDLDHPEHPHYLWLDQVRDILPLGSA
ncbi:MAG TPA: DUF3247 family protein [Pseudoxanthomonas sp.]|jgi:homogentisate 1,2-dioxygenase|nr:DUF3247 family protein [Pseudoxanthomonas sp.]